MVWHNFAVTQYQGKVTRAAGAGSEFWLAVTVIAVTFIKTENKFFVRKQKNEIENIFFNLKKWID